MEPEPRKAIPSRTLSDEETASLDRLIQQTVRRVVVPPPVPPTAAELARRKRVFAEIQRIRAEIGPVGISAAELIRQDRGWPEETDG